MKTLIAAAALALTCATGAYAASHSDTGNPILLGLLDYLTGVRRHAAWQREWEQTYRRLGVSTFTTFHCEQHAKVVACIAQGQGDEAATAMRQHLETIFEAMKGAGPVS